MDQKTKIIATLGDPRLKKRNAAGQIEISNTYKHGLHDFDQELMKAPTVEKIVDLFFRHQVDVIRINLAHVQLEFLPEKFRRIKAAVLKAEKKYRRKIGILADLPGPKIRFNQSNWIIPKNILRVSFDKIDEDLTPQFADSKQTRKNGAPNESLAQINLDEEAFSAASQEAKEAVKIMLAAVDTRLEAIKNQPEKKLLAFIGDNDCTLQVLEIEKERIIVCKVVSVKSDNRVVGESKGFTVRGIPKPIKAFTSSDRKKLSALFDADFEITRTNKAPYPILSHIGISFCQDRDDVLDVLYHVIERCIKPRLKLRPYNLKNYLVQAPLLIAKIETEEGVKHIDRILDFADGAMIARGDLAVEIETADVPRKSKRIISRSNLRGKPVIMATQMLESMKDTIECTRPEATDVFSAVVDNVDALMLSGETSSGKYPAHTIEKMRALAKSAEQYAEKRSRGGRAFMGDAQVQEHFHQLERIKVRVANWQRRWIDIGQEYSLESQTKPKRSDKEYRFIARLCKLKHERLGKQHATDRITHAVCLMSVDQGKRAIVAPTTSGRTARMLARFRPRVEILALPHTTLTVRKLTAVRGVVTIDVLFVRKGQKVDLLIKESRAKFRKYCRKLGGEDVTAIFTCGSPLGEVGTTNMIQRWDARQRH